MTDHLFTGTSTNSVRICSLCGKWPDHHNHGDWRSCTCESCDELRRMNVR